MRCGFTPRIDDPRDWIAGCSHIVRWPGDSLIEQPRVDGIYVPYWRESYGCLEEQLSALRAMLEQNENGPVVVAMSFANRFAPSRLRELLEGGLQGPHARPALSRLETGLALGRVLRALAAVGFIVDEVQSSPGIDTCPLDESARAALRSNDILLRPSALGRQPERYYVRARSGQRCSGSVLVARLFGDDERKIDAARVHLQSILPDSWQVLVGESSTNESSSWNSVVSESRGERIWLLASHDRPSGAFFERLQSWPTSTLVEAPGRAHGLAGSMLDRSLLYEVGPFVDEVRCPAVAAEEWRLRVTSTGAAIGITRVDDGDGIALTQSLVAPDAARDLVHRWSDRVVPVSTDATAKVSEIAPWRRERRDPTISLCMIVRDEEAGLGRCLARVAPIVDEIIVVDTGSTDRTMEIAARYGARVLNHEWNDDFAEARNVSLAAATSDWILVLDADEVLDEASADALKALATSERAAAFLLHFVSTNNGSTSRGLLMLRFFRNFDSLRYVGAIHEQLTESLQEAASERGLGIFPSDLRAVHSGYEDAVIASRGKRERNRRIFEKQLALTPNDPYCLYKYGDFLRSISAPRDRVIDLLRRSFEILSVRHSDPSKQAPFAAEVASVLALELCKDNRHDEARDVVDMALARFMPTPNLTYVAACLAQHFGLHADALELFERLLHFGDKAVVVPIQDGITDYVARAGIAMSLSALGRVDRAEAILHAIRRDHPDWEPVWLHSASVAMQDKDPSRALELLAAGASHVASSEAMVRLGESILTRVGLEARIPLWRSQCAGASMLDAAASRTTRTSTECSKSLPGLVGAGVPEGARP
ncbi:MAG: glycosyltransferase [Planctomycetes bacterium]|nr:glycosyltransferase [Planctomycetota bacterium]MCB9919866.1 glycosyltransferase [Planctomycetota bacterium]